MSASDAVAGSAKGEGFGCHGGRRGGDGTISIPRGARRVGGGSGSAAASAASGDSGGCYPAYTHAASDAYEERPGLISTANFNR